MSHLQSLMNELIKSVYDHSFFLNNILILFFS